MQLSPADNITIAVTSNQNIMYTCELLTTDPKVAMGWEIQYWQIQERDNKTYADSGIYIRDEGKNMSKVVITAEGRRSLSQNQTQTAIPILCYSYTTTTFRGGTEKSSTSFMILFGM